MQVPLHMNREMKSIEDHGQKIKCMGLVYINILVELSMLENGGMENNMAEY